MTNVGLLEKLEEFLEKDLKGERLSPQNSTKRRQLVSKVREAIEEVKCNEKLDQFLDEQRTKTRLSLCSEIDRSSLPLPQLPSTFETTEEDGAEDLYMDFDKIMTSPVEENRRLSVQGATDGGSGSGYESYASDEESDVRTKSTKEEEQLNRYFTGTNCAVYSFVFLENKSLFSKTKWIKRIGLVRENHFQCFKKLGDNNPVLDLPLKVYSAHLCSKDGTKSMIVNLESIGSLGDGYRFYVQHANIDEWSRILKEKAASISQTGTLPLPRLAPRPTHSLPANDRPMIRQSSLGVVDPPQLAINDIPVQRNGTASPTSPPIITSASLNNIGKGLKTAVSDMFKKDKTKKKISVAEQLGAGLCGNLSVFVEGKWLKKFCFIKNNQLFITGKEETPEMTFTLHGCDLQPHWEDPDRTFTFKLIKDGKEIVFLEATSSDDMGRWIGRLIAETGCAEISERSVIDESIYVQPEVYRSVMDSAKEAFNDSVKTKAKMMQKQETINEEEEDNVYWDLGSPSPPLKELASSPAKISSPNLLSKSKAPLANPKTDANPTPPLRIKAKQGKVGWSPKSSPDVNSRKKSHLFDSEVKGRAKTVDCVEDAVRVTRGANKDKVGEKKSDSSVGRERAISLNIVHHVDKIPKLDTEKKDERQSPLGRKEIELELRLQEIQNRLKDLGVNKTELVKYVDAASNSKSKANIEQQLARVNEKCKALEEEKVDVEERLKTMKNTVANSVLAAAGNRRPPTRSRGTPSPKGNVMSRAKMFENL